MILYLPKSYLIMVLMILSTSCSVGGFWEPVENTRLMGSNNLDNDLDKYAVSNLLSVLRSAFSGLK